MNIDQSGSTVPVVKKEIPLTLKDCYSKTYSTQL
jgi:hypothetical protein